MLSLVASLDESRYRAVLVCVDGLGDLADAARDLGLDPVVLGRNRRWDVSGVARFARLVHSRRAGVVHGWLYLANFFARVGGRLGGAPVVVASEGGAITTPSIARERVARAVEAVLGPATDAVIANSQATAAGLRRLGVSAEKIEVVYNGVEVPRPLSPEGRSRLRASVGAGDEEPLVAMVARLDPDFKDHGSFLRALARLHGVRGAVVGDGPGRPSLEALARDLGLSDRVAFTGFRPDASRLLAAADVSVLLTYSEGFSNVVLESMAAGVPLVTSDVPANREAVRDGVDALIVPIGAPVEAAAAIDRLLRDRAFAAALGGAARARVAAEFSLEAQAQRTMDLYDRLLARKRR